MSFEGTSSSVPAYLPMSSPLVNAAGLPIFGRPVIPTQACETLGDKGDIIFCAFSEYLAVMKTEGLRTDISMHLWFDYDCLAYRFILRIGGFPWWAADIDPRDGSNALGAFVAINART